MLHHQQMVVKVLFIVASPTHGDYGCSVVKLVVTVAVIAGDDCKAHRDRQCLEVKSGKNRLKKNKRLPRGMSITLLLE
ncbi:hypothetical protein L2E82_33333 [Cichorium intybus]|uniref:Uncharacterized protein n=1 Tax=Cichorium intybus TaxID=13427 RepID=A0ACB9BJX1_CICIN|nr:hypothetical protein L2E82_33333 [Cichorium intybus]